MNYLDLFSGIGGFALGAYWAGWRFDRHYFSEIDPWCCELYQKRFPDAVPLGDIKGIVSFPPGRWCVSGGFPCQPFSTASRGRRTAEDLWPEMARVIQSTRAEYVIAENVSLSPIIIARDFCKGLGYSTRVYRIPAAALGACHYRLRYWMAAHTNCNRKCNGPIHEEMAELPSLSRLGEEIIPGALGGDDGLPERVDRLKGLGNSIVPQIAELIFRQLKAGGGR